MRTHTQSRFAVCGCVWASHHPVICLREKRTPTLSKHTHTAGNKTAGRTTHHPSCFSGGVADKNRPTTTLVQQHVMISTWPCTRARSRSLSCAACVGAHAANSMTYEAGKLAHTLEHTCFSYGGGCCSSARCAVRISTNHETMPCTCVYLCV